MPRPVVPIFASPSYHGYDTIDYETINPDYGTNADFARLDPVLRLPGREPDAGLVGQHRRDRVEHAHVHVLAPAGLLFLDDGRYQAVGIELQFVVKAHSRESILTR